MSGSWMYLVCLFVMIGFTYGNTGTDTRQSCHIKCDVVQELNLIRQLLNQESLLRMNTINEIQELKKAVKDLSHNSNQLNNSIATKIESLERATNNQFTSVQRAESTLQTLETTTDSRLKSVQASFQRARSSITTLENSMTSVQNDNRNRATKQEVTAIDNSVASIQNNYRSTRQDLTTLERTLTSMNKTYQERVSPVAFTATLSYGLTRDNGKIVFNNIITNVGGAYSSTTGIFTCPSTGHYIFTWTLSVTNEKSCYALIYINDRRRPLQAVASLSSVKDFARSQSTVSGIFHLSAGDRVWIQTNPCTEFTGSPNNAFSGWKL